MALSPDSRGFSPVDEDSGTSSTASGESYDRRGTRRERELPLAANGGRRTLPHHPAQHACPRLRAAGLLWPADVTPAVALALGASNRSMLADVAQPDPRTKTTCA
ncbi:MAG: hypothetical protein ACLP8S_07480 [Solirubrobacteraceae bacterium]